MKSEKMMERKALKNVEAILQKRAMEVLHEPVRESVTDLIYRSHWRVQEYFNKKMPKKDGLTTEQNSTFWKESDKNG